MVKNRVSPTSIPIAVLLIPAICCGGQVPVDPGFEVEVVAEAFQLPTALALAPDGRIFVAEKNGRVRVIKNGSVLPDPLIQLTDVNAYGDRGLHGLALDPAFAENGYVYLMYTYENTPGTGLTAPKTGRIVRVTAEGDTASESTKVVILGAVGGTFEYPSCEDYAPTADCIPSDSAQHSVGALRFGPDGMLYASMGDGAQFTFADPRSMRAQDIDRLSGKVLRIHPDGSGPADNPFFNGDPDSNRSKVWMYGLRYPYRFGFRPDGAVYIGDVGWRSWEEVDHGAPGSNFGWPCYEGVVATEHACAVPGAVEPVYSYSTASGAAVIAGGFPGNSFPSGYRNSFFFGDYVKNHVQRVIFDASGNFSSVATFLTDAGGPVDFQIDPDGDMYYVAILDGTVRRIVYTAGNRRPVARISSTTTSGLAPLVVNFSSVGSFDPDGDPMTFDWSFGDGNVSSASDPVHTYLEDGAYTAILRVTDPDGRSDTRSLDIVVGNRAPAAIIDSPGNSTLYDDLDTIQLSGSGLDPEEGGLGPGALRWEVILHHNVHIHFLEELSGPTPAFTAPDHGAADVYLEVRLTVTDSGGLSTSTSINLYRDNSPFDRGENLVLNPSLEIPDIVPGTPFHWRKGGFGSNQASMTYPVAGADGTSAARIDMIAYTSGDRKWYFDPVYVTAGLEYRFSNRYRSDVDTRITVEFGMADGTNSYLNLGAVPPSPTWQQTELTFVAPPDARTATLFHGIRAVGFLEVDDYWFGLPGLDEPVVALLTPADGAVVSGLLRIEAVPDSSGAASIVFALDGIEARREFSAPYTFYLDTTTLPDGYHVIVAATKDKLGNRVATTPRQGFYVLNNEPPTPNLIANPSVETPNGSRPDLWRTGQYGVNDAVFTYPVPGFSGSNAVRIDVASYSTGEARWYFDDVPVVGGREYVFSDYYASTVDGPVWARFTLGDGSPMFSFLGWADPSPQWKRSRFVFVAPPDARVVTVFHSIGDVGTLVADAFALRATGNEVLNPALEFTSPGGDPFGWSRGGYGINERTHAYPVPGVTAGNAVRVSVGSRVSGDGKWYSDEIPVQAGQSYLLADYYRSSAPSTLKVRVRFSDGSVYYPFLASLPPSMEWARAEEVFQAPPEAVSVSIFHFLPGGGFLETDQFLLRKME